MPYDFQSVGGNAANAIIELLAKKDAERRQAMLDDLTKRATESTIAARAADTRRADTKAGEESAAAAQTLQDAKLKNALTIWNALGKGAAANPALVQAMKDLGLDSAITTTPEKNLGLEDSIAQGSDTEIVTPGQTVLAASPDERKVDANADLKLALAGMTNDMKNRELELKQQLAENKITQDQYRLGMQEVVLGLRERLMTLQGDKIAGEAADKEKARTSALDARKSLHDLAVEIKNDPNLPDVVGAVQGRLPSVRPTSLDLDNRIKQLVSSLSLENRQLLKGSGAISDFESGLLGQSATSLDQRTDSPIFIKELDRIIENTSGDQPSAGSRTTPTPRPSNNGPRVTKSAADLIKQYGGTNGR